MALSFQSVDVSSVTNGRGRFTYDFDKPVDQVFASADSLTPLALSAAVTGEDGKQVTVTVYSNGSPVSSKRVNVSLLGVHH